MLLICLGLHPGVEGVVQIKKILAMNASARLTMKDAANCDKQCELQNSENHKIFERTLRFRVFLKACLTQRLL